MPGTTLSLAGKVYKISEFISWGCCNKAPQTGELKPQKCVVSQSGGQKSETKVSAGPAASEASGGICSRLLSQLLGASGMPWLVDGCLLPVSSHCFSSAYLSLSPNFPFL